MFQYHPPKPTSAPAARFRGSPDYTVPLLGSNLLLLGRELALCARQVYHSLDAFRSIPERYRKPRERNYGRYCRCPSVDPAAFREVPYPEQEQERHHDRGRYRLLGMHERWHFRLAKDNGRYAYGVHEEED